MAVFTLVSDFTGTEPISLDEAKAFLRVDDTADDDYITEMVKMARQLVEKETNAVLVAKSYSEYYSHFPRNGAAFVLQYVGNVAPSPIAPSILYNNTSGGITTLSTSKYTNSKYSGFIKVEPVDGWATDIIEGQNAIKLVYNLAPELGLDSVPVLPLPLKQAMYLLIGHFYDNRSAVNFGNPKELPLGYNRIINQYKNTRWS